eukprot:4730608-Pyramimonas_sp.AAC.2
MHAYMRCVAKRCTKFPQGVNWKQPRLIIKRIGLMAKSPLGANQLADSTVHLIVRYLRMRVVVS